MTHKLKIEEDAPLSSIIAVLNHMDLVINKEEIFSHLKTLPGLVITPYESPKLTIGDTDDHNAKER